MDRMYWIPESEARKQQKNVAAISNPTLFFVFTRILLWGRWNVVTELNIKDVIYEQAPSWPSSDTHGLPLPSRIPRNMPNFISLKLNLCGKIFASPPTSVEFALKFAAPNPHPWLVLSQRGSNLLLLLLHTCPDTELDWMDTNHAHLPIFSTYPHTLSLSLSLFCHWSGFSCSSSICEHAATLGGGGMWEKKSEKTICDRLVAN